MCIRLNYRSAINCKNKNDFFQINHHFIINANKFLEKLSIALKKAIANDILTQDEKKLILHSEKNEKSQTKMNNSTNANFSKLIEDKDEEIKKLKSSLEGMCSIIS